jgi:hypothetical protein
MRTPIIVPGQVFLHTNLNQYLVVVEARQGEIRFKGVGFAGMNDVSVFLERFEPVDPVDLLPHEAQELLTLVRPGVNLSVGWVTMEGDDEEEDEAIEP